MSKTKKTENETMNNFMTIVIKYHEGAELPRKLTKAFTGNGQFEDAEITAISLEDEISRVEELEQKSLDATERL